ncbi:uncharacterized protein LOC120281054 [Dioscorea cayenensis subsp. rotundata]|uniref:Uncharacterized protein LOC120281054 n=1 Tax=Dioscorea cayennensis subsp. rotundata TaxID=55577 RepID=A0AB40CVA3_DIOCR|nr:uncharacterized protein LOC120281054 [Dioscorea cayenensis subsp. rotundata]
MNQDFVKLERFDGTNFTRWKDKMLFLLSVFNIAYVLGHMKLPLVEPKEDESIEEKKATFESKKKKWIDDEFACRGHILNTLSNQLYDLYMSIQSSVEIWKALEEKYNTKRHGTVHELQVLANQLCGLKIVIPELLQVGAIISKLPLGWNDYWKKLLHMAEEFMVEKLQRHIRIEEEARKRDAMHVLNSSKVNYIENDNKNQKEKRKTYDDDS